MHSDSEEPLATAYHLYLSRLLIAPPAAYTVRGVNGFSFFLPHRT